jgi:cytoskeletal protein RodZ
MRIATGAIAVLLAGVVWGASQTKPPAASSSSKKSTSKSSAKSGATKKKSSSTAKTSSTKRSPSKSGSKSGSKTAPKKTVARQTQPDGERSREIQTALQSQGYLSGEPSGHWDAGTSAAFAKYQQDHGIKPTGKPDARSLIGLGLGPKYDNQIQPKSNP